MEWTLYFWPADKENIPKWRQGEFAILRQMSLRTGRAWAIKEALQRFGDFIYAKNVRKFFQCWFFWATHSRLPPIIRVAKTLKIRLQNILTYFRHRITNATAEGLNSKIQMVKEMACGFRNRTNYKSAIYFHCAVLNLNLYPCRLAS